MRERLDDNIDALARERALKRGALGLQVAGENKIGGNAFTIYLPASDHATPGDKITLGIEPNAARLWVKPSGAA